MSIAADIPGTVPDLLRRGARDWPDRVLVILEDGTTWTWSQALEEGSRAANALAARGIGRGDRVMMLLPNGASWLRTWWGTALLGAVMGSVNPAYKGRLLADVCDTVDPAAIVAGPDQAGCLEDRHRKLLVEPETLTTGSSEIAELDPPALPSDIHCLLMTSGTTGPSKASMTTHAFMCHLAKFLVDAAEVDGNDVFQADLPWFHLSAFAPAVQMMRVGGTIAIRATPAMSSYWQTAKATGATFTLAPGTIAQFLESQPPSDADRDHAMRFVLCSPLPSDPAGFMERFGLSGVVTAYGSTEANIVLTNMLDFPIRPGSCGKVRPGFEIRLVDDHDAEVAPGEVGELIVRADQPWLQTQGYLGNPEATVRLLRNGWVHTGDALRRDEDGYFYFHDRYKDSLRRRGENISSSEVEREVLAFPGVAEAAVVAGLADHAGDDEVKVFVVAKPDAGVDFEELLKFLADRMTYFMVPRFYELIDELPKTPTQRVQKHELRDRGNSEQTWDREAAGYRVTRDGLVSPG